MFTNFFKIAFRNLTKRKWYSLLNILGLTIGMTCCMLIFHYVSYEKSYDDFHANGKNIVRLRLDSYQKGKLAWKSATIYPAIAPTMKRDFPEVENFCRLFDANLLLTNERTNVKFNETQGYFADPAVLKMFDIKMLSGNPDAALDGPDKMIISEAMAKKYFGREEPMGKKLIIKNPSLIETYEISGVFKDYPKNSHLDIEYLVSWATLAKINRFFGDTTNALETSFGWYDFYSYLQLRPGTDPEKLQEKFPAFCERHIDSQEFYKTNNYRSELHLLPITDIHLYSNYNQEAEVNGNGQVVAFLFLVALLIISIAWGNYINLATARSIERAREVGIRKVMGAVRFDLIRQFLVESLLLNLFALFLSVGIFYLTLRSFDGFTGKDSFTGISMAGSYWQFFLGVFMGGTLLSGLYPAFVLSAFQPVSVLKGIFKNSASGLTLRKALIIAQFITSVVLIAGTIVVYQQVSYMRRQQLGANINQTLVIEGAGSVQDSLYQNVFQPFKNELLQQPAVKSVTSSSIVMGKEIYWTSGFRRLGADDERSVTLYIMGVDYDFIPSYEIKMIAGRNFSKEFPTDERAVLINEKAVDLLGFKNPADAINSLVRRGRTDSLKIVGVIRNYHHQGLQKMIDPMIVLLRPNLRSFYSVKMNTNNLQQSIAGVQGIWNKYFPADPFNYSFLDENFNEQYKADTLFGKVFGVFSFLAILIACFGLLGLSAYNVLLRTKEIGIRKVLGASGKNILLLLSKDFMRLIIIALVLAIPVGWFLMHKWLQDFAYRVNISWWVFAIAGFLALMIALVTIVLQAMKAVVTNPVKSLRTE